MQGTIKQMLDRIIQQRSRGNAMLVVATKTKIVLKGVNPDRFTEQSEDDPIVINKVRDIAQDLGIYLS